MVSPTDPWAHDGRFGERVRLLRTRRGISKTELGEKVGVKAETVARWEVTNRPPRSAAKLRAAADALSTTPGFLLLGEEEDGE